MTLAAKDNRANLIRAFKATGCAICGKRYPEIDWSQLHVHHIDARDKTRGVVSSVTNSFAGGGGISRFNSGTMEKILAELLLCQVLCQPCHAQKHRNGDRPPEEQMALFNGDGRWRY